MAIPDQMQAAVYRGRGDVRSSACPVPEIEPGEVLVRVLACGVCSTDLKKVELGLLSPPRIFGHETVGKIVAVGEGVRLGRGRPRRRLPPRPGPHLLVQPARALRPVPAVQAGRRHGRLRAGRRRLRRVRARHAVDRRGRRALDASPRTSPHDEATFLEPVNTCLKGIRKLDIDEEHVVLVAGVGSIGLLMQQLADPRGCVGHRGRSRCRRAARSPRSSARSAPSTRPPRTSTPSAAS